MSLAVPIRAGGGGGIHRVLDLEGHYCYILSLCRCLAEAEEPKINCIMRLE